MRPALQTCRREQPSGGHPANSRRQGSRQLLLLALQPPQTLRRRTFARAGHTAVRGRDGRIYVIGGEAGGVQSQTSVEMLYTGPCPGDMNADREVNLVDLTLFLSKFGNICP
ncbi:MAG: hypothetical protein HZB38_16745 [Planctomycetes bacterium]|nr:hypothetical protein [Planctomycetota bacterium]